MGPGPFQPNGDFVYNPSTSANSLATPRLDWAQTYSDPPGVRAWESQGAGHATVAGACVTILKAWFDHGWELKSDRARIVYEANADGTSLLNSSSLYSDTLTVEGELNKLAGNISIARDWVGVHYYTDYIESLRLGEQIALGLLEEQKLTYRENFSLTVPLFDGTSVRI